jgi:ring-1,2-phenylacetyl-CoA epoxidase subunit PaaE
MRKYHKARIKEILRQTDKAVQIELEIEQEGRKYFAFKPGQFLSIKKEIDGQDVRRSYSLCSSPHEGKLCIAVKEVEGGVFSTYANRRLVEGEEIEVFPPEGRFTVGDGTKGRFVFFAAGSGITPVLSNIKFLLETCPQTRVILFYSNSATRDIIFKETLDSLKNKFFSRFSLHHFLSREALESPIFSGRISRDKLGHLDKVVPDLWSSQAFFVCGPEAMILMVVDFLKEKGVKEEAIHFELFTLPGGVRGEVTEKSVVEEKSDAEVWIRLGGLETLIQYHEKQGNLLDAALEQGMDLPYACKGGVCSTCKAKLLEGSVSMKVNYALEPDEIENNIILTCQACPTSEKVKIDFDIAS